MKKIKLILSISIALLCKTLQSQNLNKMVSESNYWYNYGKSYDFQNNQYNSHHIKYLFSGDTIINGNYYKKLLQNVSDSSYSIPTRNQSSYYKGAFRQDSFKVYFIPENGFLEELYCDFDIHIGDTLKYYYNNLNNTVISIDSVAFGSSYRKKYTLSNNWNFYEGIGNELGLLRDFSLGVEGASYLTCFQQNNEIQNVYAFSGESPVCRLSNETTAIQDSKYNEIINLISYPNPTKDNFNVLFNYDYNNTYELKIHDIRGLLVYGLSEIKSNSIFIERGKLTSGIYLISILKNNRYSSSIKLIIE